MDFTTSPHTIPVDEHQSVSAESYSPELPGAVFVFAHGAGAGMNHTFMKALSSELAQQGIATLRFNFLYMEQKKKRPDFPAVAHKVISAAIDKANELFPEIPILAGGKSFGGRMTSQFLASKTIPKVKGVVFVGFPLHPAGKPSVERATHLSMVNLPMLFLQGTRDALADWKLIEGVGDQLPLATLIKFDGADHSFKAGKQNLIPVISEAIRNWMKSL
jgi:predicted alpha/beta-hydrolase family hydrolase